MNLMTIIDKVFGSDKHAKNSFETRDLLYNAFGMLEQKEVIVLVLHSAAGLSFRKTGEIVGLSPERIRQIEKKAYRKLRHPARSVILEKAFK